MATWAKGVNFKNSTNTKNIGGLGVYGNDSTVEKLYIGLGAEPWNNVGLQLTTSAINFKGNKIYHAGDKPTAAEIGAAAASHSHSNYVSTNDYRLTTISKTLTIGTSWIDTGIVGTNLETGSYIVQVSGMADPATSTYSEIWTGCMTWYSGGTNSGDADEIVLHKAGHASNNRTIYLRTLRSWSGGSLKLQISANVQFSSTNVTFKFRKLI